MRLVYSFIFGSLCIVFSLAMLFEVVKVNDVLRYCESNNLILIDKLCTEDVINYGLSLFVYGLILGSAGFLMIISVLVAPDSPNFGGRESINI